MKPLISIIIPAYNAEKLLCRCVNSILAQPIEYMEIILIDDGSTDKTPELCNTLSAKYDSVKVIHKINGGVSSARNSGIKAAQGKYIAFIDSDDYLETEDFGKILNICMENDLDVCLYKYKIENENGGFNIDREHSFFYNHLYTGEDVIIKNFGARSACIAFFKSEHIREHSISFCEEMSYSEDADFVFHSIAFAKRIMFTHYTPYVYAYNKCSAIQSAKHDTNKALRKLHSNVIMIKRLQTLSCNKTLKISVQKQLRNISNSIICGYFYSLIYPRIADNISTIFRHFNSVGLLPIIGKTTSWKTTILIPIINSIALCYKLASHYKSH